MKHSYNTYTQGYEKGIAGRARNDGSFRMKKAVFIYYSFAFIVLSFLVACATPCGC
jgi:hypothetical protein